MHEPRRGQTVPDYRVREKCAEQHPLLRQARRREEVHVRHRTEQAVRPGREGKDGLLREPRGGGEVQAGWLQQGSDRQDAAVQKPWAAEQGGHVVLVRGIVRPHTPCEQGGVVTVSGDEHFGRVNIYSFFFSAKSWVDLNPLPLRLLLFLLLPKTQVRRIGAANLIPKLEEASEGADSLLVVKIVPSRLVERPEAKGGEGQSVTAVSVGGLEHAQPQPDLEGREVAAGDERADEDREDVAETRFNGVSVLGRDCKGGEEGEKGPHTHSVNKHTQCEQRGRRGE